VADELLAQHSRESVGSEVMLQLFARQQVVKVVRDGLRRCWGSTPSRCLHRGPPSVWMIVGVAGLGQDDNYWKACKMGFPNMDTVRWWFRRSVPTCGAGTVGQVAKAVGTQLPGTGTDKPLEIVKARSRKQTFR